MRWLVSSGLVRGLGGVISMVTKKGRVTPIDVFLVLLLFAAFLYTFQRLRLGLHYHWSWEKIPQYFFRYDAEGQKWVTNFLMEGFLTTIRLSIWTTILAAMIGTGVGLCRASPRLFYRLIGRTYVELIRNIPPIVVIFIIYYFLSDQIMTAIGMREFITTRSETTQGILRFLAAPPSLFSAFLSALVALALIEGAYVAEIVRAGIQSVETGQWEAARSLGLSRWQQMRHVVLPQAVRRSLPPLAGQFISTIKDSAIASVISIQELTFQGMELMSTTFLTIEVWVTITVMYLLLCLSLSLMLGRLETSLANREAYGFVLRP